MVVGGLLYQDHKTNNPLARTHSLVYDRNNVYWQRSDSLLKDQESVVLRIRKFNEMKATIDSKVNNPVTQFLNESSP